MFPSVSRAEKIYMLFFSKSKRIYFPKQRAVPKWSVKDLNGAEKNIIDIRKLPMGIQTPLTRNIYTKYIKYIKKNNDIVGNYIMELIFESLLEHKWKAGGTTSF